MQEILVLMLALSMTSMLIRHFCPNNQVEDEFHFIMSCTAYAFSWQILWLNLENSLLQDGLVNEWRCIMHASDVDKS
jgi:hypothetical protein